MCAQYSLMPGLQCWSYAEQTDIRKQGDKKMTDYRDEFADGAKIHTEDTKQDKN